MIHVSPASFIAGVIAGVLLAGTWAYRGSMNLSDLPAFPDAGPAQNQMPDDTEIMPRNESGAVEVADQAAGNAVFVGSITVPPPGVWVAVREMRGHELGNVLGAARVTGPRSNVSVPLLRVTEPNRTYAVQLYRDDNIGAFDPRINSVYVDFDTGARVVAYFTTK